VRGLLSFLGATIGGSIGWWLGDFVGFMTAFVLSTVGSVLGWWYARRWADENMP
jgi:membrane protein YqaA with SNARE-associated domain